MVFEKPSEVFARNRAKPQLNYQTIQGDPNALDNFVFGSFRSGTLGIEYTIDFLVRNIPLLITDVLSDDWESFQVKIGSKNTTISPMDILNVNQIASGITLDPNITKTPLSADIRLTIIAWLAMCYRLSKIHNKNTETYEERLMGKARNLFSNDPWQTKELAAGVDYMKIKSQGWAANASFRMIMAAMDFFFVKFPSHIYGSIRLGTAVTRYEDCSIISLLKYLSSLFGVEDAFQYILFPKAIKEFKEITSSYEETDKRDSFMPYCRSLGIVSRSPFSSTANRHLHTYIHMCGALLGVDRSYNSRRLENVDNLTIMNIAIFVVYHLKRGCRIVRIFFSSDQDLQDTAEKSFYVPPSKLLDLIQASHGLAPLMMRRELKKVLFSKREPRQGTIGEYLRIKIWT